MATLKLEDDYVHREALGGNAVEQLRAYVVRIEKLEEEISQLNDDKSEIYKEAKAIGFCKKTMRKLITRRKQGKQTTDEEDQLLALYEAAING